MHRRIQLERVVQAQLLADFAHRRHHFLAQQADAGAGVRVRNGTVIAPDAVDARARFFEDAAQLRDDGLRGAKEDAAIGDLLLESRTTARADGTADRELDELPAMLGREIAGRARPYRVGKTGELALHPQELAGVALGLFLAVGDVHLLQIAAVLGAGLVAGLARHRVVQFPDLLGGLDRGVQRDIGVALLRRPDDRFARQDARDPDPRIRLLQWHGPGVDDAVLVMRALEAERTRRRPRLDDKIVRLLEALAVESRIDPGRELLLPAAADKSRYQP